jgi:hypothetical protein
MSILIIISKSFFIKISFQKRNREGSKKPVQNIFYYLISLKVVPGRKCHFVRFYWNEQGMTYGMVHVFPLNILTHQ